MVLFSIFPKKWKHYYVFICLINSECRSWACCNLKHYKWWCVTTHLDFVWRFSTHCTTRFNRVRVWYLPMPWLTRMRWLVAGSAPRHCARVGCFDRVPVWWYRRFFFSLALPLSVAYPFHYHGWTLILAWISNHSPGEAWDDITYPPSPKRFTYR